MARPALISDRLLVLTVRAGTVGLRFSLVALLGRADPLALADFGLLSSFAALAVYAFGLEYHLLNNRRIVRTTRPVRRASLVAEQMALHLITYLPGIPLLLGAGVLVGLRREILVLLPLLVVLEQLVTEMFRVGVATGRPVAASLVLFLESAAWIPYVIVRIPSRHGLDLSLELCMAWCVAAGVAAILGAFQCVPVTGWRSWWTRRVAPARLVSGVRAATTLWSASLCMLTAVHGPRLLLGRLSGALPVASFTFYWTVSSAVTLLVEHGIAVFSYPSLVAAPEGEPSRRLWRRFQVSVLVTALVSGLGVVIGTVLLNRFWLQNDELRDSIVAGLLLVAAAVLLAVGVVPYYRLYALRRDRAIRNSALVAAAAGLLVSVAAIPAWDAEGAAAGVVVFATTVAAVRWQMARRLTGLPPGGGRDD
jgi:hypothetical protein